MAVVKSFQEFESISKAVEKAIDVMFDEAILMEGYIIKNMIEGVVVDGQFCGLFAADIFGLNRQELER